MKQGKVQQSKTSVGFYGKQKKIQRYKTFTSTQNFVPEGESNRLVRKEDVNKNVKLLTRMKSIIDETAMCSQQISSNVEKQNSEKEETKKRRKTVHHNDEDHLTSDFIVDWEKMTNTKKNTYSKLRNKFVEEFPAMRKNYSDYQITVQKKENNEENKSKEKTEMLTNSGIRNSQLGQQMQAFNYQSLIRKVFFYSRSKKKCMSNLMNNDVQYVQMKENPIPKLNYLKYRKGNTEKKKLKTEKIKGLTMIKKREEIMELEKYGTRPYNTLKKCLEDAIDECRK